MGNINSKIQKVYYDKTGDNIYGSVAKIYDALKKKKVSFNKIKNWLKSQDVYTLHYPVKKRNLIGIIIWYKISTNYGKSIYVI